MDNQRRGQLALLQLPLLAHEKIIENLDEDSKINLLQTNAFFRDLITEIRGININFDLYATFRKSFLNKLKETPLKSIQFTNSIRKDTWKKTPNGTKGNFCEMFPFPLQLQTVAFSQKVDARWIFDVLEKCRNLDQLIFNFDIVINGDLNSLLLSRNDKGKELKTKSRCFILEALCRKEVFLSDIYFTKLTFLYIDFRQRNLGDEEFMTVFYLIKSLRSEVLKRVFLIVTPKVDLSEIEYFRTCWILGEFLEFHNKTLQDISIGVCIKGENHIEGDTSARHAGNDLEAYLSSLGNENVQTQPNEIQGQGDSLDEKRKSVKQKVDIVLALREQFENIAKKSKISFVSLEIPVIYHWDFWHIFIENLHRLCTVRMICSTNFNILKNCAIICGSYKTLKRLRLDLDLKNPFDCAGLADCERLEEFYLFYEPLCGRRQQIIFGPNEPNVLNVNLIPAGLKSLALSNVVVSTKDINKALSKQNNLDTLAIMNMGCLNPKNGADYKSLKKVFRMRNLQSCLLFQIRCLTKAIHKRTVELLEFQFNDSLDCLMKNMYIPAFQAPLALDIISTECYRRYNWESRALAYHLRFNDEDPHL